MTNVVLGIVIALLAIVVIQLLLLRRSLDRSQAIAAIASLARAQERLESVVRDEIARNRSELSAAARDSRQELTAELKGVGDSLDRQLIAIGQATEARLSGLRSTIDEKLMQIQAEGATASKTLREEIGVSVKGLNDSVVKSMSQLAQVQQSQLESVSQQLMLLTQSNESKLDSLRTALEERLTALKDDNSRQLEQMRQTVDEKLQATLEKRLSESFKLVGEQLETVHQGIGEMRSLAQGVVDLKKVLANVKTRGTWGEVQLGALLEQVLSSEQYATNVLIKDEGERVEYAIRLPGRTENPGESIWLPIDAKFPIEDYQRLIEAQERADVESIEATGKQLEATVQKCARDIHDKYLDPPQTTDFAILFLPTEGLFAEVIRRSGLCEALQREFRVVVAGPTTLWSLLNGLQMGFKTLAIQQRSGEIWNLLSAVKTEWSKYGDVLAKVQKKLGEASRTIDEAQKRSRVVGRKLTSVQELPTSEAMPLLDLGQPEPGEQDEPEGEA